MMYQYPLRYFLVMIGCLSALLIGCTKDNLEIYNRPESLAAPIYQQLDTKGNFKTLLQVIDKSGYKSVLSTGGYWTLFAPNDDAFAKYFTRKGVTLSSLDSTQAQKMVQSMLVFNAYTKDKLGDYQKTLTGTSGEQSGLPGLGFRRKSAYSKGVYDETSFDGTKYKAVGMNASKRDGIPYSFNAADNNYKYLTYFTDEFMGKKGLGATDYNVFFPSTTYSGFNVMGAKVTEADIVAENGMIHIVDDVVESELSADDYLKTKPEYSTFRNLIEKYAVFFKESLDMTVKYNNRTRTSNKVYIKQFDKFASATGKYLAFNPTSENISSAGDNTESQSDIPTMMAPTNAVLDKYINEVILEKYKSLDELPTEAVIDLINAHLSNNAAWPTKIQSSYNELGEVFQQNVSTDIIEKKLLSNAMFYGTNKVQVANVFSSVYSRIYLDPSYSIMKRIIDMEIKPYLLNPAKKYTLFLISDSDFKTAGYEYNPNQISPNLDQWVYTSPTGVKTTGASVLLNMRRIVGQSVIPYDNGDLTNLASQGVVTSYTGEPVKFNNNVVVSSGIQTSTTPMTVVSKKECSNGVAYYTKGNILNFAPDNTTTATPFLTDLAKLGATTTSPYYQFYQYLKGSSIYQSTTASTILVGIPDGLFYTFLIPDNNAVLAAVKAGLLPVTATKAPNYTPTLITEKAMIDKFVQSHIVKNFVIPVQSNGQKGQFLTLLKSAAGDSYQINIDSNTASGMTIIDPTGRSASINISSSNNISNRTVFHSINNYLLMQ